MVSTSAAWCAPASLASTLLLLVMLLLLLCCLRKLRLKCRGIKGLGSSIEAGA